MTGQIDPSGRGVEPVERGDHLEVEVLPPAGVDDRDRPRLEPGRAVPLDLPEPAEVAGHLLQRALGGREADPDEPGRIDRLQPLQQDRQEDPALVRAEGVNLVDDHVRERSERRACLDS